MMPAIPSIAIVWHRRHPSGLPYGFRHDENGDLIGPVVRDGRPDLGMPPIPLSPNQVGDIVAFVKSRVAAADIRSANRSVQGSGDKLLTGNSEAGKAFFEGAGGCTSCHSPTGDLAGISQKYSAAVLQARFLYPQQRRRTVTVTDADGKQHRGELLALTNYDVSIQHISAHPMRTSSIWMLAPESRLGTWR
jgi:cytochrome c oxidase cbb3-type subunit III